MKKLQFAMVGGGNGALIGDIHRIGAQFDDLAELKAGCFSRHWDKNLEAGEKWGVEPGGPCGMVDVKRRARFARPYAKTEGDPVGAASSRPKSLPPTGGKVSRHMP